MMDNQAKEIADEVLGQLKRAIALAQKFREENDILHGTVKTLQELRVAERKALMIALFNTACMN